MSWILINDGDLVNLDYVFMMYLECNKINFEFCSGDMTTEEFSSVKEASLQYASYADMVLGSDQIRND